MNKIDFKNLPDTSTPLSAENLNLMQDNIENAMPTLDSAVSTSSTNGVENQAITNYINDLNAYSTITLNPIDTTAFSGTIILRKYGKVVSLEISSFTINSLSANTWKDVVNIPDEYLPASGAEVRGTGLCDLLGINAIINTSKKLVINSRSNAISTKGLYLNMTWITD